MILTHFALAEDRLAALHPLIEDYEVATDPSAEFPNNVLSKRTVIWDNGAFGKAGETPAFSVEADELALVRALADGAAAVAGDLETGMGSESSDPWLPFFIAANTFDPKPNSIDPALVAARFGGTLFPAFSILVEPLKDGAAWWDHVLEDAAGGAPDHVERWTALRAYFTSRPELIDNAFVSIGVEKEGHRTDEANWPPGTIMAPCSSRACCWA